MEGRAQHTVASYDVDLRAVRGKIVEMGHLAAKMIVDSVDALDRGSTAVARSVISADIAVDHLQREVEEQCIQMIARRQPLAIDLRETVSAIRISSDLERIGDPAKNIAKRVQAIDGQVERRAISVGVDRMAELVAEQLRNVVEAYGKHDRMAALDVWRRDDAVDALYTSLFRELLMYMMEDPRNIMFCTHLLFCAKNLERIGDHTTNIAESVHYLVTGETLPIDRPKDDRSIEATSDTSP
jgi:phosphate transport system protein